MSNTVNRLQKRHANRIDPLRLVEANRLGRRAMGMVLVKPNSPWDYYSKIYSLKLGENEPVIVAERKGGPSFDLVSVRPCQDLSQSQLELLRSIQHANFVTVHEVYNEQDKWYIVMEHMPRSLQEAVGNPFLDSSKLAAIIGQIVTALGYLEDKGLRFGSLTCSDVLLHPSRQHYCTQSDSKDDIRRLGNVMMELMDGYVKDGANIGIDNPERWNPEALHFLGATTSASSAKELLQVCILPFS
ncbi:serine/threonine protein kinase [Metarhizium brunneum]